MIDTTFWRRYPTLARYIEEGIVWVEAGDYVGQAEDGTIVQFGSVGFESQAERYLAKNPPSRW